MATADAPQLSPLELKRNAILRLQRISTPDPQLAKTLQEAIDAIERSVEGRLFLDRHRILPPPAGNKVFLHEREAVSRLQQGIRNKETPQEIRVAFEEVMGALVEADRRIAESSLEAAERLAQAGCLEGEDLRLAQRELARGRDQADPKAAITAFEKAWQLSQTAFGDAALFVAGHRARSDLFSPSVTAHVLTVELEAPRGARPATHLEIVEIIQDASDAVIRTLTSRRRLPAQHRAPLQLTAAIEWDGRNAAGGLPPDGRYVYTVFGRLTGDEPPVDCKEESSRPTSAPVTGALLLDNTPPSLAATVTPRANANGWHRTDARIEFRAVDNLSGVVSLTSPIVVTAEGAGQRFTGSAVDAAGNRAELTVTLHVDKTPPAISPVVDPAPNERGWHRSRVNVSFQATDALSGIERVTPRLTLSREGAGQVVAGVAVDRAGNRADTKATLNIDRTPPRLTVRPSNDDRCQRATKLVGTVEDSLSGVHLLLCDRKTVAPSGSSFECNVTLADGDNRIDLSARDQADNLSRQSLTLQFHDAALELAYVDRFELRYDDAGSGATFDGAFYAPVLPPGFRALGHYGDVDAPRGFVFAARGLTPGALANPVDHVRIWHDGGSGAEMDGSIWQPVCPSGYVSLGAVAQSSKSQKPPLDAVSCVRRDLTVRAKVGNQIYNDHKSGADQDLGAWQIIPDDDNGIFLGTFTAIRDKFAPPTTPLFTIDARKVRRPFQGCTSMSPSALDVERWIQDFGPVLQLHPEDRYLMDDAEHVLDASTRLAWGIVRNRDSFDSIAVGVRGQVKTSSALLPSDVANFVDTDPMAGDADFMSWLELDLGATGGPPAHLLLGSGDMSRAKALVRVRSWNHLFTELQFWFFYPFNGPGKFRIKCGTLLNRFVVVATNGRHYGDWEQVTLRIAHNPRRLAAVYMSRHDFGEWVAGSELGTKLRFFGTHPLIYSARDSHAHYPTPGTHFYKRAGSKDFGVCNLTVDLADRTADGGPQLLSYLPGNYRIVTTGLDEQGMEEVRDPEWLGFVGNWGQFERLSFSLKFDFGVYTYTRTEKEVGNGPAGPPHKDVWHQGPSSQRWWWTRDLFGDEACHDGVDNDGDGWTDCMDAACHRKEPSCRLRNPCSRIKCESS